MGGGGYNAPPRTAEQQKLVPVWADAAVAALSGITAAFAAAPFIMTVDKAVTQAAAGTSNLWSALGAGMKDVLLRPNLLLRNPAMYLVGGVYGSTYLTANLIDTCCERGLDPEAASTAAVHGAAKLFGTTAVNMSAGITKDALFARWFGAGDAASRRVPPATFGLFAVRDTLTIAAAFTVPALVANAITKTEIMDEASASNAAQLISPMGMQASYNERVKSIGGVLPQSIIARMFRFCCAYGIGGLLNTALLRRGREYALTHFAGPDAAGSVRPPR